MLGIKIEERGIVLVYEKGYTQVSEIDGSLNFPFFLLSLLSPLWLLVDRSKHIHSNHASADIRKDHLGVFRLPLCLDERKGKRLEFFLLCSF